MKLFKFLPLVLLAGCAVGPDYSRPSLELATSYYGNFVKSSEANVETAFWERYNDKLLNEFINRGLLQNLDIKAAQERIRQAEASLRSTGVNSALSGGATGARTVSGGESSRTSYSSSSSLNASIVLDLFGGLRREREAAKANVLAYKANLEQVRLAWLAELIAAYADARYYQEALALTRETIKTRVETINVVKRQFEVGDTTEYNLAEAQALLDSAKADLPNYMAQFNAEVFAISTLLDEPSGPLMKQMSKGSAQLRVPGSIAAGVPADLMRNRPDVRYYEALLHAATAEIGVATADMLPSVSLSGTVSVNAGVNGWSYGPSLNLPVFNQGALKASRDNAVSAARQAEIAWRASVAAAIEDVQVAQSNLAQYVARASALQKSSDSYRRALGLVRKNYNGGAITLLDVLDTDRSTASAQISAAAARNEAAKEWATLQIAIGAGASIAR